MQLEHENQNKKLLVNSSLKEPSINLHTSISQEYELA